MSKKSGNPGFGAWLQRLGGGAIFVIGLVTTLVSFVKLWQGDAGLVTLVLLIVGVLLVWLACLYFVRFWQPEQEDESPQLVLPVSGDKQEKRQQKQEKKRKIVRRLAVVGLVLVPLLAAGGGLGWRYVQSLPSNEVVILVADFDGPDTQNYRVTETILQRLRQKTQDYEDVTVAALEETVTEQAGSEAARAIAKRRKATIMIWGWYGAPGDVVPVSINFEVLNPSEYLPDFGDVASGEVRNFALAELSSFELQPRLSSEMSYLTLFTLGIAEHAAENWDTAIDLFDASLEELEESDSLDLSPTFFYKGNAHLLNGSFDEAIAAYDAALKIKPDLHEALNNKGVALGNLGQYEQAIAAYDAALKIKTYYHEALYNKGYELGNLGQHEQAIAAYDAALKIKPYYHEALYNKGNALANLGQYEQAITAYDAALKIKPDKHKALYNKGYSLAALGQYEEAITAYDAALKIKPDKQHEALHNRGNALAALGQYEEAITAYDAALKIKPDDPYALHNRGNALDELGRYEQAITAYKSAIAIQPSLPNSYAGLSFAYAALGKKEQAIESLEKFLARSPDFDRQTLNEMDEFKSLRSHPRFRAITGAK